MKTNVTNGAYNKDTSTKYLVDSATIYTDVEYNADNQGFTGELIGATSGGVSFTAEIEFRDVELDGISHMKMKNNKVIEMATATIVANFKELTLDTLKRAMNAKVREPEESFGGTVSPEAGAGYQVLETTRIIESGSYIKNMAIVGKMSGTNDPIIIIIENALATGGLELATEDNSEAVIEQTFEAHGSESNLNSGVYPWKILFPNIEPRTEI